MREPGRTAGPSASLGMTKGAVTFIRRCQIGWTEEVPCMNAGAPTIALFSSHGSKGAETFRPRTESRELRYNERGHPCGWPLS